MRILTIICLFHVIVQATVTVQPVSDSIAIKVPSFEDEGIASQTLSALAAYNLTNARSVVIDLRSNSGGYLYEAIGFAALFVNNDQLITVIDNDNQPLTITRPIDHPHISVSKLTVIINSETASAAEAAAHILSLHPNVVVIGTNSYGKLKISQDTNTPSPYSSIVLPSGRIIPSIIRDIDTNSDFDTAILSALAANN